MKSNEFQATTIFIPKSSSTKMRYTKKNLFCNKHQNCDSFRLLVLLDQNLKF